MRLLTIYVVIAALAGAQFFPFPGPGRRSTAGGGGTPTFVQSASNNEAVSGTTVAATFPGNVTAGSTIAVMVAVTSGSRNYTGVTDSQGNTYTLVADTACTGYTGRMAYAVNVTGGAITVTGTINSASAVGKMIVIHEISGVSTNPFDGGSSQCQTDPGTGTDAVTSPAVVPTVNGAYIFGATISPSVTTTPVAGTGFTQRRSESKIGTEDLIQATAASIAATFTIDSGTADPITGVMAFKPL